jgi:hypothetical protein
VTLQDLLGADAVKDRMVIRNGETGYGFPFPMYCVYKLRGQRMSGPGMSSCQCIFPGWVVGLESPAPERKAALDTVTLAAQWYDFNDQCSFYAGTACAGYDPAEILDNLHELIARYSFPNGMITGGGGGTENFAVTPAALAAMFVQSYQRNIHLFPDWPADRDAEFGNLNACGGFLVSSAIEKGRVRYVRIKSTAGEVCRIENPWPGVTVTVSTNHAAARTLGGKVLEFPTSAGDDVMLQP